MSLNKTVDLYLLNQLDDIARVVYISMLGISATQENLKSLAGMDRTNQS